jgi:hypothetical protein
MEEPRIEYQTLLRFGIQQLVRRGGFNIFLYKSCYTEWHGEGAYSELVSFPKGRLYENQNHE